MAEAIKNKRVLLVGAGVATLAILWLLFRDHPAIAADTSAPIGDEALTAQTPQQYAFSPDNGGVNVNLSYDFGGGNGATATPLETVSPIAFAPPSKKTANSDSGGCCGDCGGCGKSTGPVTAQNLINEWTPERTASAVILVQQAAPPQPPKYWTGYWVDQQGTYHYAPDYQPARSV
jgi:hypothetical protein